VATQPSPKAAPKYPPYLHTAEVADILHVSPKTVSRWAKEGKLPFLKTLGGHRRYPEAEIRQLANELQVPPTAKQDIPERRAWRLLEGVAAGHPAARPCRHGRPHRRVLPLVRHLLRYQA
jgi:excisionase family DNA binding protein